MIYSVIIQEYTDLKYDMWLRGLTKTSLQSYPIGSSLHLRLDLLKRLFPYSDLKTTKPEARNSRCQTNWCANRMVWTILLAVVLQALLWACVVDDGGREFNMALVSVRFAWLP